MDVFDSTHICNHTDEGGRYAYKVCYIFPKPLLTNHPLHQVSTKYDVRLHLLTFIFN